jgi:hypothetical protein
MPSRRPGRTVASVFTRVLVVLDSRSDRRDALVLGAQLVDPGGALVVADLLATESTRLAAGAADAARRRARLRDAGDEVYATLGPDPRVRYLPVSGLPMAEAITAIARREGAQAIVLAQRLVGEGPEAGQLIEHAPCPVVIAPYGHRFDRAFAPRRIGVGPGDSRAEQWVAGGPTRRVAAVVEKGGAEVDLLVLGSGADGEALRRATRPVLVVGDAAAATAVPARR